MNEADMAMLKSRVVPIDPNEVDCWECSMPFNEGRERVGRIALVDPQGPGCAPNNPQHF